MENEETDSGQVVPSNIPYVVTYTHGHPTLREGDVIRVAEYGRTMDTILIRDDFTLHNVCNDHDQYVHLRKLK